MTNMKELVALGVSAMTKNPPADYSIDDVNGSFREEIRKLAGDPASYRRNKLDLFELMERILDEVLPKQVLDRYGVWAEFLNVPNGTKAVFQKKVLIAAFQFETDGIFSAQKGTNADCFYAGGDCDRLCPSQSPEGKIVNFFHIIRYHIVYIHGGIYTKGPDQAMIRLAEQDFVPDFQRIIVRRQLDCPKRGKCISGYITLGERILTKRLNACRDVDGFEEAAMESM